MRRTLSVLCLALVIVAPACKSKSPPPGVTTTAASAPALSASIAVSASASASSAPEPSVHADLVDAAAPLLGAGKTITHEVRVSSRADDVKASPLAPFDGDMSTGWSPATTDATPTLAFELERAKTKVHAMVLAVTGVSEVKVTWTPRADEKNEYGVSYVKYGAEQTLAERVALDPSAAGLQRIAIEASDQGVLTLTILKQTGAAVAVRELRLESDDAVVGRPTQMVVGGGKPRGKSGIVPESALDLQCVAAVQDPPRAYCFGGTWASDGSPSAAAFVMIDASGAHALRPLTFDFVPDLRDQPAPHLRWDDWLAIEKTLSDAGAVTLDKRGSALPAGAIDIPWGATASAFGATLRQRETSKVIDDFSPGGPGGTVRRGTIDLQWPGAATFSTVMTDAGRPALGGASAFARPLGSMWLIERTGGTARAPGSNATETVKDSTATGFGDAILCDPATKKCTSPS